MAKNAEDGILFIPAGTTPDEDPITKEVREKIVEKQNTVLKDWLLRNATTLEEKDEIEKTEKNKLREFIANQRNEELVSRAYKDPVLTKELTQIEITGYRGLHEKFSDNFKTLEWEAQPQKSGTRSIKVEHNNKELCTLTETTVIPERGSPVSKYRTIDFPPHLNEGATGPMHVSMAAQDAQGNNIDENKAVYFTAHYDKEGKLTEISYPQPMKFMGKGDNAVGYFEMDGQTYTLPITKGNFNVMMREVEKNRGQGVGVEQDKEVQQEQKKQYQDDLYNKKPEQKVNIKEQEANKPQAKAEPLTNQYKNPEIQKELEDLKNQGLVSKSREKLEPSKAQAEQQPLEQSKKVASPSPAQMQQAGPQLVNEAQPVTSLHNLSYSSKSELQPGEKGFVAQQALKRDGTVLTPKSHGVKPAETAKPVSDKPESQQGEKGFVAQEALKRDGTILTPRSPAPDKPSPSPLMDNPESLTVKQKIALHEQKIKDEAPSQAPAPNQQSPSKRPQPPSRVPPAPSGPPLPPPFGSDPKSQAQSKASPSVSSSDNKPPLNPGEKVVVKSIGDKIKEGISSAKKKITSTFTPGKTTAEPIKPTTEEPKPQQGEGYVKTMVRKFEAKIEKHAQRVKKNLTKGATRFTEKILSFKPDSTPGKSNNKGGGKGKG